MAQVEKHWNYPISLTAVGTIVYLLLDFSKQATKKWNNNLKKVNGGLLYL